jgi:hypothetical protein
VTLTLYDVPADYTGSLPIGASPTPISLSPGQGTSLTFVGTATQQVTVRLTGNTIGKTTVRLLAPPPPNGPQLTLRTSSLTAFNLTTVTLSTSGNHTIVIDPSDANAGSINVAVTSP